MRVTRYFETQVDVRIENDEDITLYVNDTETMDRTFGDVTEGDAFSFNEVVDELVDSLEDDLELDELRSVSRILKRARARVKEAIERVKQVS